MPFSLRVTSWIIESVPETRLKGPGSVALGLYRFIPRMARFRQIALPAPR
jgi:hypothetical protein